MGDDETYFVVGGRRFADVSGTSVLSSSGTSARTFPVCALGRFDQLMLSKQVGESVTRTTDTIQITCSLNSQAYDATDDSLLAGQGTGSDRHRRGGLVTAMVGDSLTGIDLHHWIALRRVFDGEVTKLDDCWRDHGHPVPGYVTDSLNQLLMGELVTLADPDPAAENIAPAALTNAGVARFEQLCQRALGRPAAQ
jgi:hypothetical protein